MENDPIEEVLKRRDEADYRCFMALKMLLDNCDPEVLQDLLADYNGGEDDFAKDIVDELKEAVEDREVVNGEFMTLLQQGLSKLPTGVPTVDRREK